MNRPHEYGALAHGRVTFAAVMDGYLAAQARTMKPRSHGESARHLRKQRKPLHKLPLASIDRSLVASTLRAIEEDSGPVARNRTRSTLSAMFAWAIGEGHCEANPVMGTNKAEENGPRERRSLTDAEIAAVWLAAPENEPHPSPDRCHGLADARKSAACAGRKFTTSTPCCPVRGRKTARRMKCHCRQWLSAS